VNSSPPYIDFRRNSKNIPSRLPAIVQNATTRFLALREAAINAYGLEQWQELRQAGHDIRLHTIENLHSYLEQVEQQVQLTGGQVHWARSAEEARQIVLEIAQRRNVKRVVKAKSMATEEIGLAADLQRTGISVLETDLGEFIVQLAGDKPSHITGPALHLAKEDIARLFCDKLGVDAPPDAEELSRIAAAHLRQEFLAADMGISGGNFLVADTGTLVLLTNEGNGRLCTTLPPVFVAVVGIEKVIPNLQSLAILLTLLPRNATGQQMTSYVSLLPGLKQGTPEDRLREFHLVLLDNGRSEILRDKILRETLLCIRCGACLNICPVYNNVGGHAYGWTYSGPIGAILTPQLLGLEVARALPFASTLCGACNNICPVKVPITEILLRLRQVAMEKGTGGRWDQRMMLRSGSHITAHAMGSALLYEWGAQALRVIQIPFRRNGWLWKLPPPLNRWTNTRPMPAFGAVFRKWWRRTHKRTDLGG
jgi:L-lactate dehydrogenase complex protein LldF